MEDNKRISKGKKLNDDVKRKAETLDGPSFRSIKQSIVLVKARRPLAV